MSSAVQHWAGDRFAKGQESRDLRVSPDPPEPGMQFVETIGGWGRLLSLRREFNPKDKNNQPRLFKMEASGVNQCISSSEGHPNPHKGLDDRVRFTTSQND
jgi:hypothetical protein